MVKIRNTRFFLYSEGIQYIAGIVELFKHFELILLYALFIVF